MTITIADQTAMLRSTSETSADVGVRLARYMKATERTGGDPDQYAHFVERLLAAPCNSSVDALALLSWVGVTLPIALAKIPEDDPETADARSLVAHCGALVSQAVAALSHETGIPPEAFIGSQQATN